MKVNETPGVMASEEARVGGPTSEETSENTVAQLIEMLIQERADRQSVGNLRIGESEKCKK